MTTVPAVAFSYDAQDLVRREGTIFVCGEYPDRAFAMNAGEADAAIASFQGAELELEHFLSERKPSILDGKLGRITRLWRNGTKIMGEVAIPSWLDPIWAEAGHKISAVWGQTDKRLLRAGIVISPRVPEATLVSAYSSFAGARHSAQDLLDMQTIHDITTRQGATCADDGMFHFSKGEPSMSFLEDLKALINKAEKEVAPGGVQFSSDLNPTAPAPAPAPTPSAPAPTPSAPAPAPTPSAPAAPTTPAPTAPASPVAPAVFSDSRVDSLVAEVERLKGVNARATATSRIETLVRSGRIHASEALFALENLTSAMLEDDRHPVTFSVGEQKGLNRAAMLLKQWESRPANPLLDQEAVPAGVLTFGNPVPAGDAANPLLTPDGAYAAAKAWAEKTNPPKRS